MIRVTSTGDYKKTEEYLMFLQAGKMFEGLDRYGRQGVDALSRSTPRDTGRAATSWVYEIANTKGFVSISWLNTDVEGGVNIAVILQYGHGTGTGGYVQGRDYINPAMRPIFDKMVTDIWRQVTNG